MPKVSMGYVKKIKKNKKEENSHAKKKHERKNACQRAWRNKKR